MEPNIFLSEPKFFFLIVLGVVSLIYIITLFFKESVFQFILKSCLVPFILAVYISGPNKSLTTIVLALVFAWLGDVLLIKINNPVFFRFGLASFLIGHIFYIITMFTYAMPLHVPVLIISVAAAVCYGIIAFKAVKPSPEMKIPVIAYETIILIMVISALQLFLAHGSWFGVLIFAGSLCFLASDTMLALVTFRKKPLYVYVMITYIAAQLLIALGFCLLG
ncbi:lysoplasmalogenase [Treponema sp. R80B11-R83G3]